MIKNVKNRLDDLIFEAFSSSVLFNLSDEARQEAINTLATLLKSELVVTVDEEKSKEDKNKLFLKFNTRYPNLEQHFTEKELDVIHDMLYYGKLTVAPDSSVLTLDIDR